MSTTGVKFSQGCSNVCQRTTLTSVRVVLVKVPVLWDKQTQTIVSNDSWSILKMFCTSFRPLGKQVGTVTSASLSVVRALELLVS